MHGNLAFCRKTNQAWKHLRQKRGDSKLPWFNRAGLQNVRNPASAACRQGPNFVGRKGSGKKRKKVKARKEKVRKEKERGKKKREEKKKEKSKNQLTRNLPNSVGKKQLEQKKAILEVCFFLVASLGLKI